MSMSVYVYCLTVLGAMGADNSSFNSAEEKSSSVMYELAGAKFVYKRDGDREEVSTLGPIKDRIVVKVGEIIRRKKSPFSL